MALYYKCDFKTAGCYYRSTGELAVVWQKVGVAKIRLGWEWVMHGPESRWWSLKAASWYTFICSLIFWSLHLQTFKNVKIVDFALFALPLVLLTGFKFSPRQWKRSGLEVANGLSNYIALLIWSYSFLAVQQLPHGKIIRKPFNYKYKRRAQGQNTHGELNDCQMSVYKQQYCILGDFFFFFW